MPSAKEMTEGWGLRLRKARKALGMTQEEVGDALDLRNTAVSKWEQESTDGIDSRSLLALESTLRIRQDWVAHAKAPMMATSWDRTTMDEALQRLSGAPVEGFWEVPKGAGMEPLLQPGELVFWTPLGKPTPGMLVVATPITAAPPTPGTAPERTVAGHAFPSPQGGWLLYRLEDKAAPGSYPPIDLQGWRILGRIAAKAHAMANAAAGL